MLIKLLLLFCGGMSSVAYDKDVLMSGDVILGGLFSVQTYGTAHCNQVDAESLQIYEAVRWFLKKLNDRNYIKNVNLGFHAFNTCDEPPYAVQATLDMLEIYEDKRLYGVLGPGRSSETQLVSRLLSSLPEDKLLPQLSYSATAATLSDKTVYGNLLRVIVPDNLQIEVLHQLVLSLKWNYIAIVYELDTYGTEGATTLKKLAETSDICVPVYFGIPTEASAEENRKSFGTLKNLLEKDSESPVVGLVFIGRGSTAKTMFDYLELALENFQVIASEALSLNVEYLQDNFKVTYPRAKGLLTLSPPSYDPISFKEYWKSLHSNETILLQQTKGNNWLLKYMETVTGCLLENVTQIPSSCLSAATTSEDVNLSFYISYALTAVASFAKTIKSIYDRLCPQQSGICAQMSNMRKSEIVAEIGAIQVDSNLDFPEIYTFNSSFSFTNGEITYLGVDENVPTYSVYNFKECDSGFCFQKVGDHIQGKLSVSKSDIKSYDRNSQESPNALEAQCQAGFDCLSCKTSTSQGEVIYIPGNFYVVGMAPIHDRGTGTLQCGALRTAMGVDIAESIVYAIKRINLKRDRFAGVLSDKSVGLVVIDTCNNPLIARERVIKLERGELQLNHNTNSSSLTGKIIGYIGPYGSSVSVPISSVMAELDKVFISYASTSSTLSSKSVHPTFMRTCSPDYKQANVMMYLAKELKTQYVQIIYTDEEYGRAGVQSLRESANNYKICIAQALAVPDSRDGTVYRKYVSELRRYPHAKIVIIFVRSHATALLVTALNQDIDAGEFIFLGGEAWGKRNAILEGNDKSVGSLTLAQELPKNRGFEDYFSDIYVPETVNPWLRDYLEAKAGCYYPMSFNKISGTKCTTTLIAQVHQTDSWVPFAINAVYALVLGFSDALESTCSGSVSICPQYTTADLISHVKDVRLDIYNDGGNVRVFDDNGEGSVGYAISQVVRDGQNIVYKKVGDSSEDIIQFSATKLDSGTDFTTKCQNDIECERCKQQFNDTLVMATDNSRSTIIGLGVFVAILFLIVIALVVLGILWWRRNRPLPDKGDPKHHQEQYSGGGYINAIHEGSQDNSSYVYARDSAGDSARDSASADGYSYLMTGVDTPGVRMENESGSVTTGTGEPSRESQQPQGHE